jgi:fructose-1-phosphate kinase PfkB-like protein
VVTFTPWLLKPDTHQLGDWVGTKASQLGGKEKKIPLLSLLGMEPSSSSL